MQQFYLPKPWGKAEKYGSLGWGITWAVSNVPSASVRLMFTKPRRSVQGATLVVLTITNAFYALNWQDNLDNLFTLVHENRSQYAFKAILTVKRRTYVLRRLFYLLRWDCINFTIKNSGKEKLLEEVEDDATRIAILNNFLRWFPWDSFPRQTQFAEFGTRYPPSGPKWRSLDKGISLNKPLRRLWTKSIMVWVREDNPWNPIQGGVFRIPHFYSSNYYVYPIFNWLCSSLSSVAEKIVHDSQGDRDRYIDYLKAGKSDYPWRSWESWCWYGEGETISTLPFAVFERRLNEFGKPCWKELGLA